MKSGIDILQDWYASQCDGKWEHEFGIEINTIDNPGWHVKISIKGTRYENFSWPLLKIDNGKNDWIFCSREGDAFTGAGDPKKLGEILSFFETKGGRIKN